MNLAGPSASGGRRSWTVTTNRPDRASRTRIAGCVSGHSPVATTMTLAWISAGEWQTLLAETGFELEACYGWFDRSPYRGGEDMIFVARTA